MYLDHFGMRELPFGLTPNTRLYVNLPGHHEVMNGILASIHGGEGFVKVTGEVGTGKTVLCRQLLRELGDGFLTAYLPDPFLSPLGLRHTLAEDLGIPLPIGAGSHGLLRSIRDKLVEVQSSGRRTVLVVDEAQALPSLSLETLRLLTNLETETAKLLQVVLFGQPELDIRLARPALRQLAQRIAFSYRVEPMSRAGVAGYVSHRIAAAGYFGIPLFTSGALRALHTESDGIARTVNILCHKALMVAWSRGEKRVRKSHLRAAIADTQAGRAAPGRAASRQPTRRPWPLAPPANRAP